ncbi:hypothetical protein VPNG_09682 [Cytospora leucostoma]|uniref:Uncharacterized protein n=1 Tax=Cytospora leucostoma TaxID=1230097 RepID=A0A423VJR9_9PEZI|nr:hypothetical protein VPNG_09682 [Cytospora leucostoma]
MRFSAQSSFSPLMGALLMLVTSLPLLQTGLTELIALGNRHIWDEPRVVDVGALGALRGQVSFARRLFRMFRFLESFQAANKLYATLYSRPPGPSQPPLAAGAAPPGTPDPAQAEGDRDASSAPEAARANPGAQRQQQPPAEAWLDMLGRTFNGMYLLLETLTLLDSLQQPGLSPWGPAWYRALHAEGQRFWFLALALGAASGLTKIVKLFAYAPVPPTGEGYGYGTGGGGGGEKDESLMADWERERERLRRVVWRRREQRELWRANIRGRLRGLVEPMRGPPPPHLGLVAEGVLQRLLDVHHAVLDLLGPPAVHAGELAVRVPEPPVQHPDVAVQRRLRQDGAVEAQLVVALEPAPQLEHADLAVAGRDLADLLVVAEGHARALPPPDRVDPPVLRRRQDRLAGLEVDLGRVLQVRLAPPLEHVHVAPRRRLLQRRGRVLQGEAGPPPPLQHVHVAVLARHVEGLVVVLLLQEGRAPRPPVQDLDPPVVRRRLGRYRLAVEALEHVGAVGLDVAQHPGQGELEDELDGQRAELAKALGGLGQLLADGVGVGAQDRPLELVLIYGEGVVGVAWLEAPAQVCRHGEVRIDAARLSKLPVVRVLEYDAPQLGGQLCACPLAILDDQALRRGVDIVPEAKEFRLILDDAYDLVQCPPPDHSLGCSVMFGALVGPQDGL